MFLFSVMVAAEVAHADNYPYLTFQKADGSTVSMETTSLSFTFSDGKLIGTNGSESVELVVADLTSMRFTANDVNGIKDVSPADGNNKIEAFSLLGVSLGKFDSLQTFRNKAAAGVYIIKSNGETQKITVR